MESAKDTGKNVSKYLLSLKYLKIKRVGFIAFGITYYHHKSLNGIYIHIYKIRMLIGKDEFAEKREKNSISVY